MYTILYALFNIVFIFALSTSTAYSICRILNKPFINPEYSKELINSRAKEMAQNVSILLLQSSVVLSFFYKDFLDTTEHNRLETIGTLLLYVLIAEGGYYTYHTSIHRSSYYKIVHKKHHTNSIVYPFDTYYFTLADDIFLTSSLALPLFFLEITYFEHFISLWVYTTCSYLVHSKEYSRIHYDHRVHNNCNYCILFPIYDVAFGTYRSKSSVPKSQ